MVVAILNAPNHFDFDLGGLPEDVTVHQDSFEQPADLFLIFAARTDEAQRGVERALTLLPPNGTVWLAWESDPAKVEEPLDEEILAELFADTGLVSDGARVINDTWEGVRFVVAEENRDDWEDISPSRELGS